MQFQTDLQGNHLGTNPQKPWKGICCEQCWNALGTRCRCRCGGAFHGMAHGNHAPAVRRKRGLGDTPLTRAQAEPFIKQIKREICTCGESLKGNVIWAYEHSGGWKVKGFEKLQWLYVICDNPKCQYQWALWKLGVPRQ